jgi:hypothetical protein
VLTIAAPAADIAVDIVALAGRGGGARWVSLACACLHVNGLLSFNVSKAS